MSQQWRTIVVIYAIAVFFNYVWELAQSSLYVGTGSLRNIWWHCGFAAIEDGFLVLVIYIAGGLVFRDQYWFDSGVRRWACSCRTDDRFAVAHLSRGSSMAGA